MVTAVMFETATPGVEGHPAMLGDDISEEIRGQRTSVITNEVVVDEAL